MWLKKEFLRHCVSIHQSCALKPPANRRISPNMFHVDAMQAKRTEIEGKVTWRVRSSATGVCSVRFLLAEYLVICPSFSFVDRNPIHKFFERLLLSRDVHFIGLVYCGYLDWNIPKDISSISGSCLMSDSAWLPFESSNRNEINVDLFGIRSLLSSEGSDKIRLEINIYILHILQIDNTLYTLFQTRLYFQWFYFVFHHFLTHLHKRLKIKLKNLQSLFYSYNLNDQKWFYRTNIIFNKCLNINCDFL